MLGRKRTLGFTVAALTGVVLFFVVEKFLGNPFDPMDAGRKPVSGQLVGMTSDEFMSRFGGPSHTWKGHYGNRPLNRSEANSTAFTMTCVRRNGTLYLSFEEVNDRWVCFSPGWMPEG